MFKYLAFAASAAEAPVPQILTKEITERVQKSGTPENVKLWMFWTPPQLELLYKYQCLCIGSSSDDLLLYYLLNLFQHD